MFGKRKVNRVFFAEVDKSPMKWVFLDVPYWRKFINRLALAGVCHFEHSEKSRRDPSSLCSVGMTPLGKLQHTSRKFSNSSRNFQFPRTQKLKYPRIFNEISAVT